VRDPAPSPRARVQGEDAGGRGGGGGARGKSAPRLMRLPRVLLSRRHGGFRDAREANRSRDEGLKIVVIGVLPSVGAVGGDDGEQAAPNQAGG